MSDTDTTRQSWNLATRNHNAHKGDQVAFFRDGGDVLFPEELELLGDLTSKEVVHLQCNAGQDTLGLARRGARAVGVDLSDEAIRFARALSEGAGIKVEFIEHELLSWLEATERRFDLAFSSYGAVGWLPDLSAWARGIARVLRPGGAFVYVEFHPLIWSFGPGFAATRDDYFEAGSFSDPVGDYVADSGAGLGAVAPGQVVENNVPATSYQHGLGQIVTALVSAGLDLEVLNEYPYANGCRVHPELILGEGRRYVMPEGLARLPLMFGLRVRKPRDSVQGAHEETPEEAR
jgi:SAM-dependent methyltransferase